MPWVTIFIHLEECGWICYPIPLLLGRQNIVDPSRTNFVVAEPVKQHAGCTPRWNVQGAGYFLQRNASLHQSWPSHVQPTLHCTFCYFSPCPYCWKCLISKNENASPTGKQLLFWRCKWLTWRSQLSDNFCRGLSENNAYLDVGPKAEGWKSQGFHLFVRQCLCYMAHKKCCEINTLVLLLVNFCIQIRQTLLFSMMSFVLLCVKFCNKFKGGIIQIEIPSYVSLNLNCNV